MKIGVIGSGNIGGNCARQAVRAVHEVMLSFSRDTASLDRLAESWDHAHRPGRRTRRRRLERW